MTIHLLAFVLVGGMAVGDSGDASGKTAAVKVPQTITAGDALLERAARDYRIQTYEMFHNDRAEYDRRSAAGARVEAAWKEAGRNDAEQPMLIHWFDQATTVSRTDSIADLPAEPKFMRMPQKHEPERKLVETSIGDSVEDAAATVDSLLHVKPISATTATPAAPQTKSSTISSLPKAFGAQISRTLQGLAGKSAPATAGRGR
jgi:hypothetical protein